MSEDAMSEDAMSEDAMTLSTSNSFPMRANDDQPEDGPEEILDEDLEDDFVPKAPYRMTALTLVLLGCLIVGVGFLAGVLTQKHHDTGLRTTATTRTGFTGGGGFTFGGGAGAGAGGAGAGGAGAGTGTTTPGGTTGGSSGATTDIPAVIGSLSSLNAATAVVTNLGNAKLTIHLSKTTQITAPLGTALKVGQRVSVYGTKSADGAITATALRVTS